MVLSKGQNDPEALLAKSEILFSQGKYQKAIDCSDRLIEIIPQSRQANLSWAYTGRAWAYYRLGEFAKADNDFDAALKLTPDNFVTAKQDRYIGKALSRLGMGERGTALSLIDKAAELKIPGKNIRFQHALLTRRKRRQKRSVEWRRWSNEYLYDVLKLYWDWKIYHLKPVEAYL